MRDLGELSTRGGHHLATCHAHHMGILDRILGRQSANQRQDTKHSDEVEGLIPLSGTTTFARAAITALATRHGIGDGGYLELPGSLQREPDNKADPNAVAVIVEGERIGYLPGYAVDVARISEVGALAVRVQIFTEMLPKGLRAEAWGWLGNKAPQWEWSEKKRPPMSSNAKAKASQDGSSQMVREALADGGSRAAHFRAGMVNGVHYLELVEPIKQLKREGRLEEALTLSLAAIAGAEGGRDGREPAPFYTEQAAIIYRKLGRRDDEIAVLKRWLALCPAQYREGSRVAERLSKLLT